MKNNQIEYIKYVSGYAEENNIHIWLGGSFLNGNSTPFSDIDISVFCNSEQLNKLIYEYDKPVFISHTSNPAGILIIIYKDNIALDLEIIDNIQYNCDTYFHKEDIHKKAYSRNENIYKELVLSDDAPYQISRLFHRSLIKFLSGKKSAGISVFNEILSFLNAELISDENEFKKVYMEILDLFKLQFGMEYDYYTLLCDLAGYL